MVARMSPRTAVARAAVARAAVARVSGEESPPWRTKQVVAESSVVGMWAGRRAGRWLGG